ncbi:MAG: 2-C-methyl-D-erythritol 4-phosphate cytidylyltransferase [Balneolaceae bacterium]|nr:2-C-methyl-D-erythritol 4-phosphate cytidylyltransferase [Balneolaceae bacterium]
MAKLAVIIPAAGSGSRMQSDLPKPFLPLGDEPILWHTIQAFLKVPSVVQVIIPTSKYWISEVEKIVSTLPEGAVQFNVIEGGAERQFSIANGLSLVLDAVEVVAVHDAVRPFINPALIMECSSVAKQFGGAIIAVPAKDTIKKVDGDGSIKETPHRKYLWQAQTPQVFEKSILSRAYSEAIADGFVGTDDASLVERLGKTVKVVEGDRENLKITYPVDLEIAELILKQRANQ